MKAERMANTEPGFFERIMYWYLVRMPRGTLKLILPNGQISIFGRGNEIQAHIIVKEPVFFRRCVLGGDVGFAESYIEGDWESASLADVVKWFIINLDYNSLMGRKGPGRLPSTGVRVFNRLLHRLRRNTILGAKQNIHEHYDLGNKFYSLFLDSSMTYSSGLFGNECEPLEKAQASKYERICKMLDLKPGDCILEIGGGWGGFAVYAAQNYGCHVTTTTISNEQFSYTLEQVERTGLRKLIEVQKLDYRLLSGEFDKIVSIEMIEAVGHHYIPLFFEKCDSLLKPGGKLMIQAITSFEKRYRLFRNDVDFIQKYIFPGSQTPSLEVLHKAAAGQYGMTLFDLKDMGMSYARTLKLWHMNFNARLNEVKELGMDNMFIRKWNYYLQYCEAAFSLRHITVIQVIYHKI